MVKINAIEIKKRWILVWIFGNQYNNLEHFLGKQTAETTIKIQNQHNNESMDTQIKIKPR